MSMTAISPHIAALRLRPSRGVHNPLEDVMSKSTLTRRALVASTAAIPAVAALGLPAVAQAVEPDPIFSAIEAHRQAWAEFCARNAEANKLEEEWFRCRRLAPSADKDELVGAAREAEEAARE
jgi:hypothetical protein